jgi:hypothetical protein
MLRVLASTSSPRSRCFVSGVVVHHQVQLDRLAVGIDDVA